MSFVVQGGASSLTLRGFNPSEGLNYSVVEMPSGSTTNVAPATVQDCVVTTTTKSGVDSNCKLQVIEPFNYPGKSFTSLTPTICSVDASGNVTRLQDGNAQVQITTAAGNVIFTRTFVQSPSSATSAVTGFVAGSLSKHVYDNVAAMVAGRTPSDTTTNIYSSNNYTDNVPDSNGHNYGPNNAIINPSNFVTASGYDFSGMTVANYYGAGFFPAKLISPRHVIVAHHVGDVGKCTFKGIDGNYYSGTVIDSKTLSSYSTDIGDVRVCYLDTAINAAVIPFKTLPSNWYNYFTMNSRFSNPTDGFLPMVSKGRAAGDKFRIQPCELIRKNDLTPGYTFTQPYPFVQCGINAHPSFDPGWFSPTISGDSSGPCFLPIKGVGDATPKLVLLFSYWIASGGANYAEFNSTIELAMNDLAAAHGDGTTYTLGHPNLSSFTTY